MRPYVPPAALRQQCTGSRRSAAQQIEEAVIRILMDWLTRPPKLVEPAGEVCIRSDQVRKMLGRAARLATALRGSSAERAKIVRALVSQVADLCNT